MTVSDLMRSFRYRLPLVLSVLFSVGVIIPITCSAGLVDAIDDVTRQIEGAASNRGRAKPQAPKPQETKPDPGSQEQDPYSSMDEDPYQDDAADPYADADADPYADSEADPYENAEAESDVASESVTDPETGITTTTIENPDGSTTVIKTDKDGNLISTEEYVMVEPGIVEHRITDPETGETTVTTRYYKDDGSYDSVPGEYVAQKKKKPAKSSAPAQMSVTDPSTGITTTSSSNPDGSRTVVKTDAEGNVLSMEDYPPRGSGAAMVSTTDPETGISKTVSKDADGNYTYLESVAGKDENGNDRILQTDQYGNQTEITKNQDGSTTVVERDIYGNSWETTTEDGRTVTRSRDALGNTTELVENDDGTATSVRKDWDGNVIETTTTNSDGSYTVTDSSGTSTDYSPLNEDGSYRVTKTDQRGNQTVTSVGADGEVIAEEEVRAVPMEEGEAYYKNVLKGERNWEELSESDKRRYASSEKRLEEIDDMQQLREAQAEERRHQDEEQRQWQEEQNRILDEKLAKIREEQAEAEAKAMARREHEELLRKRSEAKSQLDELDQQIQEAERRGDKKEAYRLGVQHDELSDATMHLFEPTQAEQQAMERKQQLRDELVQDITGKARRMAEMKVAEEDVLQGLKEDITAGTKYISVGSEMQQQTAKTTRTATREKAFSEAKQQLIRDRMEDPNTSPQEREILRDMLDMADLQQEGADRLLSDNAKITAAGYAIDAAMLASGGLGNLAAATGSKVAAKVVATSAARSTFAREIAMGATRAAATEAAEVAGKLAAREAAERFAATAAKVAESKVGQLLAKDIAPEAGKALVGKLAEHKVVQTMVTDAAVSGALDAGTQLVTTGDIDLAELARNTLAGASLAGATNAAVRGVTRVKSGGKAGVPTPSTPATTRSTAHDVPTSPHVASETHALASNGPSRGTAAESVTPSGTATEMPHTSSRTASATQSTPTSSATAEAGSPTTQVARAEPGASSTPTSSTSKKARQPTAQESPSPSILDDLDTLDREMGVEPRPRPEPRVTKPLEGEVKSHEPRPDTPPQGLDERLGDDFRTALDDRQPARSPESRATQSSTPDPSAGPRPLEGDVTPQEASAARMNDAERSVFESVNNGERKVSDLSREELQLYNDARQRVAQQRSPAGSDWGRELERANAEPSNLNVPQEPPVGSHSEGMTRAQADALFEPGRNLTREEIIQKADLMQQGYRGPESQWPPASRTAAEPPVRMDVTPPEGFNAEGGTRTDMAPPAGIDTEGATRTGMEPPAGFNTEAPTRTNMRRQVNEPAPSTPGRASETVRLPEPELPPPADQLVESGTFPREAAVRSDPSLPADAMQGQRPITEHTGMPRGKVGGMPNEPIGMPKGKVGGMPKEPTGMPKGKVGGMQAMRQGELRGMPEGKVGGITNQGLLKGEAGTVVKDPRPFGMQPQVMRDFQSQVDAYGLRVRVRAANDSSIPWMQAGHPPKHVKLKSKTINDLDVALGAKPGSQGLVGYFKPQKPKNFDSLPPNDRLVKRYQQRLKEYNDNYKDVKGLVDKGYVRLEDGVVIDTGLSNTRLGKDNKLHYDRNGPEGGTGKGFTGDHDMWDITHPDGRPISTDPNSPDFDAAALARKQQLQEALDSGLAQTQHGPHKDWVPVTKRDLGIDAKIRAGHNPGGEALLEFSPNQPPRTSYEIQGGELVQPPPADAANE